MASYNTNSNSNNPAFLYSLTYKNKLPTAPYGPYFKRIEILTSLKDEAPEYRMSTIEKNYVWQPHFGNEVGIQLDLVDQDSILVSEQTEQIHPDDRLYINYSGSDRRKTDLSIDQNKPWWLRNTTYLENNPFNTKSKLREEDPKVFVESLQKRLKNPKLDHYSAEYVESTFTTVDKTVEDLKKANASKKTLVSSQPIFPINLTGKKRSYSLIRFDEDPKLIVEKISTTKKYRIDDSIITNIRPPTVLEEGTKAKGLDVTLVAPFVENNGSSKTEEQLYEWVRDYRMEFYAEQNDDNFVILVNEDDDNVEYLAVNARIDLKKIIGDYVVPEDSLVKRVDSTDDE